MHLTAAVVGETATSALDSTSTDVVEIPMFGHFTTALLVLGILGFVLREHRTNFRSAEHSARPTRLIDPPYLKKHRTGVCKGRRVTQFGASSVTKKNLSADH